MADPSASLWIIDPSVARAENQGAQQVARDWPGPVTIFRPALSSGDGPTPSTGHAAAAAVLMGSAASVHDDLPWLTELTAWVRPLVTGEVRLPLLGICFGHQLLAHVAGAPVDFVLDDRSKLVGVEETRLEGSRLLPDADRLRVVVSHREEVKRCPAGFRVVAHRRPIAIDGIEHPTLPLFGFQFHPEASTEFAAYAGIDPSLLDRRQREDSQRLLAAFRRLALAQAGSLR